MFGDIGEIVDHHCLNSLFISRFNTSKICIFTCLLYLFGSNIL